jgi:CPL (NUC119) domain
LLSPRNSKYCAPDVIQLLKQGDSNPHSKKENGIRQAELLEGINTALLQTVQRNCGALLKSDGHHGLLVEAILTLPGDGHAEAVASVTQFIADVPDMMEHASIHRVLRKMASNELYDFCKYDIFVHDIVSLLTFVIAFARSLVSALNGTLLKHAKVNRSALVLVSLFESCSEVAALVRAELAPSLKALEKITSVAGTVMLCQVFHLYFVHDFFQPRNVYVCFVWSHYTAAFDY